MAGPGMTSWGCETGTAAPSGLPEAKRAPVPKDKRLHDQQHEPAADRRGRMRPIAAELPGLIGKPLGRRGFGEGGLIADWAAVVGEEVAGHAMPLKLAFPRGERREGTLTLRVRSAFAVELQHMAPQILERINGYLGWGAIARLKLEQGRLPRPRPPALRQPAPLDAAAAGDLARDLGRIEDAELRQALEGLGRALKGLRRQPNPAK
jgi:hypothetical protein